MWIYSCRSVFVTFVKERKVEERWCYREKELLEGGEGERGNHGERRKKKKTENDKIALPIKGWNDTIIHGVGIVYNKNVFSYHFCK